MNRPSHRPVPAAVAGAIALLLIGGGLPTTLSARPQPATTRAAGDVDPYAMTPAEFFAADAANRPIDFEHVDDRLLSAAIFHETNRIRADHDLKTLAHSDRLDAAAAMHGRDMVAGDFFAHENPTDPTKHSPLDRAKLCGYPVHFIGENLATHFGTQYEAGREFYRVPGGISYDPHGRPLPPHTYATFARDVLGQWMRSPHHRDNVLSRMPTQLGTAAVRQPKPESGLLWKFDCVQEFGDPMPPGRAG